MSIKQQRAARLYKNKSRGDRRSYKTELENALLLLAWEAMELSEGQMAKIMDTDRVSLRLMREGAIAQGMKLADGLFPQRSTP